jgi:hypothetical protein
MSAPARPRKHVPQRTCVVCREKDGKRALVRLVRTNEGIMVDPTGKLNGRGAYLCDRAECWERAIKSDVLAHALRAPMTDDDRDRLRRDRALR